VERVPKVAQTTLCIDTVRLLLTASKGAAYQFRLFAGAASQQLTKPRYFFDIYKNKEFAACMYFASITFFFIL
jgi:hypothetical protein